MARKLSTYTLTIILIIAVFGVSIAATVTYYYFVKHPTYLRILHVCPSQLANEVTSDFKAWYQDTYGRPIEVTLTQTDPQTAFQRVVSPREPEAEIWWGGPLSLFEKARDHLLPYDSTNKNEINTTCHSCPLMDLNQSTPSWYAASLYGLGIMYNNYTLSLYGLPTPQSWTDLLKEEYEGNITMVEPTESEFTSPFIMLIIQNRMSTNGGVQNWTQAWEFLVRLSAFVEEYDDSEGVSALKVAAGYTPLAILPDFYAYDKMMTYGNVNFTYLDATVLQPDPVAIIKDGTYLNEAKAFIDYILTKRAQSIIGEYRLPIRNDATVSPPRINPFASNFPSIQGYNATFQEIGKEIVYYYYGMWIAGRHELIKNAWKEIKEASKTKDVNSNATYYYSLAWNNFTYAGYNVSRSEIDTIYAETGGWTQNQAFYLQEWYNTSTQAYSDAANNAIKSKEAAQQPP
jgi:ABC-type Fe3+ transport system substrate-binding protein